MGIIPEGVNTLYSNFSLVRPGWPIITCNFLDDADSLLGLAQENGKNVTFVGRGKGPNAHFLAEVLEDVYEALL